MFEFYCYLAIGVLFFVACVVYLYIESSYRVIVDRRKLRRSGLEIWWEGTKGCMTTLYILDKSGSVRTKPFIHYNIAINASKGELAKHYECAMAGFKFYHNKDNKRGGRIR